MDPSAEPKDLELPLEFEFAMRKAQIYADEMTWDQLYSAFLNLYQQRFIEITAIKELLAEEGVNISTISTSEIKISVILEEKSLDKAVNALHKAFDLDKI